MLDSFSDRQLLLYCSILAYFSFILTLFSIYLSQQIPMLPISKISERHIGLKIRTFGEVQNISYYADITTFTLESQNYTLKCIYFGKLNYPLHKGEIIIAEGKISKYKGSLELIIEKIS